MTLKKIIHFALTKIIIGLAIVGGSVALGEVIRATLIDKFHLTNDIKNLVTGLMQVFMALFSYILLYKYYEKRKIEELSLVTLPKNALIGFLIGLTLQSSAIAVIYLNNGYSIVKVNPFSFLLPGFIDSLVAGFVAEILIRGILFRISEEKLGTAIAMMLYALMFGIIHAGEGASLLSISATIMQAGILLSAAYVFSRSLWLCIFIHFAWDFAEPGIYGGINPGITIEKSLFASKITGPELITGGKFGPGNSIQALILCGIAALIFLWLAKNKDNFIRPYWKRRQR